MNNVIDLDAYRKRRHEQLSLERFIQQQIERTLAIQRSREFRLTPAWAFVTTHQIIPSRKDDQ